MSNRPELGIIIPVNLDGTSGGGRAIIREHLLYVIDSYLRMPIDELVIANTGENPLGYKHHKVKELHDPRSVWSVSATRNMGSEVLESRVQLQTGAEIVYADGDFNAFRQVKDGELVYAKSCLMLTEDETLLALKGKRDFEWTRTPKFPGQKVPNPRILSPNRGSLNACTQYTALCLRVNFDPRQRGWGFSNEDRGMRALRLGVKERWIPLWMLHLCHPDRMDRINNADWKRNEAIANANQKAGGWGLLS